MTTFIACILLIYGLSAGIVLLVRAVMERKPEKEGKEEKSSSLLRLCGYSAAEFFVYFFCALGFPDFVMNTLILRRTDWVSMERLPDTLIAAAVTPGAVIAFSYLSGAGGPDAKTVLCSIAAISLGSLAGGKFAGKADAAVIRKVMRTALILSAAAIVVRMLLTNRMAGDAASLSEMKLWIALPFIFCFGFVNMFGVPMKPSATVLFLLLGLSPLSTLTLMLILGCVSPMTGIIRVVRERRYERKLAAASVLFGSTGAFLGTRITVSIDSQVLCILLIGILCATIILLGRQEKA